MKESYEFATKPNPNPKAQQLLSAKQKGNDKTMNIKREKIQQNYGQISLHSSVLQVMFNDKKRCLM